MSNIDFSQVITAEAKAARANDELLAMATRAIDSHVEAQARSMGYNGAAHLASYTASGVTAWQAEAAAFVAWRDDVWVAALAMLAAAQASGTIPDISDVLGGLPEWGAT